MRARHPQILTAWRLADGEVVFSHGGFWVEELEKAELHALPHAAAAVLEAAELDVAARLIVAPYLFDAAMVEGRPVPLSAREKIRSLGPTVRRDLGKQAREANREGH